MGWVERAGRVCRQVTVEPVYGLFMLAAFMLYLPTQELYLLKACHMSLPFPTPGCCRPVV